LQHLLHKGSPGVQLIIAIRAGIIKQKKMQKERNNYDQSRHF